MTNNMHIGLALLALLLLNVPLSLVRAWIGAAAKRLHRANDNHEAAR